ncbi:MAG: nucleotidyltransferase [Xenococcus sp. MO_188.B8]|nr:nucleotidyltransferase [Xenococcus sp. MO_188.B8]
MADIQKYFEKFHENIKLKRFKENATLREKRDRVLDRLKNNWDKVFEDEDINPPKYETFDQGSYDLGTGNKPTNGDYDIDVGIIIRISKDDYPDPVKVKKWIYDALYGHTKSVEIRRPCVTVFYQKDGEDIYHVDLAVYCESDDKIYLAKGKPNSSEENRVWEKADPHELSKLIKEHYSDRDDDKQFRRIIRYLKRWKDVKFSQDGNAAPIGIGVTIAAYYWFKPNKTVDYCANTTKYNDLKALNQFVQKIINNFTTVWQDGESVERLRVVLPVVPNCDLFDKMTDNQMINFKEKLENLQQALKDAITEADPTEACKLVQEQFGEDFPVPEKKDTAEKRSKAIVSSSASA